MHVSLQNISFRRGFFFSFVFGFMVRLIPEVLAFPHPIGFDTIYYASVMKNGIIWVHWSRFFTSTWLLNVFIVPLYSFGVDPFLLLKIVAPVLYGLNVAGVWYFAEKMLGWSIGKSLVAAGFFAVQLASLRVSWDLLRNSLGMGVLLFTLPFINRLDSKRGSACFVSLSLLTVFAHEYVAVTLLVIVLGLACWRFFRERQNAAFVRPVLAVLPALAVFSVGVYLRVFPVRYTVETNVVSAGDAVRASPGGVFFLTNYFVVKTSVDYYTSYLDLLLKVLVLFGLLYLPYLFLVLKGFFRNGILNFWTGLLLAGSFDCLVFPFSALEYWHRWMFMLVYPFTFYAVDGLNKVSSRCKGENIQLSLKIPERKVAGMVLLTVLLGGFYLATPVLMTFVGGNVVSMPPVYRYFSSTPTVPYQDVDSVVHAVEWLNENMNDDSCVILQNAFVSWGTLHLSKSNMIVAFSADGNKASQVALEKGFHPVYFVWWNQNIGWYPDVELPNDFSALMDFGRISVYKYHM